METKTKSESHSLFTISQAMGFEPGSMGHWPQALGYYLVTAHCWIS